MLDLRFWAQGKYPLSAAARTEHRVQCEGHAARAQTLSLSVSGPDRSEEL